MERLALVKQVFSPVSINQRFYEESVFLQKVTQLLRLVGAMPIRQAQSTRKGIADLLVCYKGRFIALELKSINGIASPQQLKFIDDIKHADGIAGVCYSLNDVYLLLEQAAATL